MRKHPFEMYLLFALLFAVVLVVAWALAAAGHALGGAAQHVGGV